MPELKRKNYFFAPDFLKRNCTNLKKEKNPILEKLPPLPVTSFKPPNFLMRKIFFSMNALLTECLKATNNSLS